MPSIRSVRLGLRRGRLQFAKTSCLVIGGPALNYRHLGDAKDPLVATIHMHVVSSTFFSVRAGPSL